MRCALRAGSGWGSGRGVRGTTGQALDSRFPSVGARLEAAPPEVGRWLFSGSGDASGGAASCRAFADGGWEVWNAVPSCGREVEGEVGGGARDGRTDACSRFPFVGARLDAAPPEAGQKLLKKYRGNFGGAASRRVGGCEITENIGVFACFPLSGRLAGGTPPPRQRRRLNPAFHASSNVEILGLSRHGADLPPRARKVLLRMFEDGESGANAGLSAAKWMRMAGVSKSTATRDLTELAASGAIVPRGAAGARPRRG